MRELPDLVAIDGETYIYINASSEEQFSKIIRGIDPYIDRNLTPQSNGGMLSENVIVSTSNGLSFYGISIRGDKDIFLKSINEYTKDNLVLTGHIDKDNKSIVLSNNEKYPLNECRISFY